MSAPRGRSGATLLELVVALAVLGLLSGVAGLAFRAVVGPGPVTPEGQVAAARRAALAERRPVRAEIEVQGRTAVLVAYPDGSVRADSLLDIDPLTGRPRASR